MKILLKIFVLATALSLVPYGSVVAEPVQVSAEVPVTVNIGAVSELTVTVRNIVNDTPGSLNFDTAGVTTGEPWRVSDQYLDIEYDCNTALWGVRIITDNVNDLAPLVVAGDKIGCGEPYDLDTDGDGIPDSYNPGTPDWDDDDEILVYSGLINLAQSENPKVRAALGWQVYADKVAKPANPSDANFSGGYNSVWAYLNDKRNLVSDTDGTRKINTDTGQPLTAGEEPIVIGRTPTDDLMFNYALIGWGGIGQALALHPEEPSKVANDTDGDGKLDVAVYLAGRFANTDYSTGEAVDFVLPGGSYQTTIYLELLHE